MKAQNFKTANSKKIITKKTTSAPNEKNTKAAFKLFSAAVVNFNSSARDV